jgi:lipopolysaccharide/colanic/teichoic acid biosynthesis glycosyltransferase
MRKRAFDILVSFFVLITISPLLFVIMLVLKFSGEGEVFFRQVRIGYKNKPFKITKFATMQKIAANTQRDDFTVQNDPRVLPIGRILREFKINELLQFWDVLRGKMSVVGPRPQIPRVHELYPPDYTLVLNVVKPGITGIGSLVFRDEEGIITNAINRENCFYKQILPYKCQLELWYSNNRSLYFDFRILILTAWCIIFPRSEKIWQLVPEKMRVDLKKFDGSV